MHDFFSSFSNAGFRLCKLNSGGVFYSMSPITFVSCLLYPLLPPLPFFHPFPSRFLFSPLFIPPSSFSFCLTLSLHITFILSIPPPFFHSCFTPLVILVVWLSPDLLLMSPLCQTLILPFLFGLLDFVASFFLFTCSYLLLLLHHSSFYFLSALSFPPTSPPHHLFQVGLQPLNPGVSHPSAAC